MQYNFYRHSQVICTIISVAVARTIADQDGIGMLYKGLGPTLVGYFIQVLLCNSYVVPFSTVKYRMQHSTVQNKVQYKNIYYQVQYSTVQYRMQHSTECSTVQYSIRIYITKYSTVQNSIRIYITIQYT